MDSNGAQTGYEVIARDRSVEALERTWRYVLSRASRA